MVQKKGPKNDRPLTEVELEIMNAVWDLEECTVKDVLETLQKSRPLAYTSVATIMKILETKKFLGSRKKDKAHVYFPTVKRTEYESQSLKHLTERVFQGNPSSMVMRLLEASKISKEELESIRVLLDERLRS